MASRTRRAPQPRKRPSKAATHKIGTYSLVQKFMGYVARQDNTITPPNAMVSPSQNVVLNTAGRVALVKGFVLDGDGSSVSDSGIVSNFDFNTFNGEVRNIRGGFEQLGEGGVPAGNGLVQYRYQAPNDFGFIRENLVQNGNFFGGENDWDFLFQVSYGTNNVITAPVGEGGSDADSLVGQFCNIKKGVEYTLTFDWAQVSGVEPTFFASFGTEDSSDPAGVTSNQQFLSSNTIPNHHSVTVTADADYPLFFLLTAAPTITDTVSITNIKLTYALSETDVLWRDLVTSIHARNAYCEYWDNTALVKLLLWVNGDNQLYAWNGSLNLLDSATTDTVTMFSDGGTWASHGFSTTGSIVINGVSATYSGGTDTQTLTGVSFDFSNVAVTGEIIHQAPIVTSLAEGEGSGVPGLLGTFAPTVIGCGRNNQVYLGAYNSNSLYISKVNNYLDYTFSTPTRLVGEGDLIPLDAPPNAFVPQEVTASSGGTDAYDVYISEAPDHWAVIRATLSSDLTAEKLEHIRLKTSPLQASQSTRLVTKMKNHIAFIGNDNVANMLGYVSYQYVPTLEDFSYPIIDDMGSYDFTDGSIFFHRNYIYVAVPKASLIRIYNMTDQTQQQFSSLKAIEDVTQQPWFWEAPVTYPIAGFYVVNGEIYGHSYVASESYKLFAGGDFNGQLIDANATFSYDDHGDRTQSKGSNELWIEGYIKQNTILDFSVSGDLDTFKTSQVGTVDGSDTTIVAYGSGGHALGKNPLGSQPLGGTATNLSTLPAWFHVVKTFVQVAAYLEQISFSTRGVDLQWELLNFGTNAQPTPEGNSAITQ